jgi:hypothetical protein
MRESKGKEDAERERGADKRKKGTSKEKLMASEI